jgi:hypothetical protein
VATIHPHGRCGGLYWSLRCRVIGPARTTQFGNTNPAESTGGDVSSRSRLR